MPDTSTSLSLQPEKVFGYFRPTGVSRAILLLCQRIAPGLPGSHALNKTLRGLIKRPPRQFDVEVDGLKLRLRSASNYSEKRQLFEPNFYDREELDWLSNALSSGDTFLDVGGNIGLYSLHVAKRRPGVRVITIEPDTSLSDRMRFNAGNNNIEPHIVATALSDYEGRAVLSVNDNQQGENQLTETTDSATSEGDQSVAVTTLQALCAEQHIAGIKAMKIDIEGHEARVLNHFFSHAEESLWPECIVIEHTSGDQSLIDSLVQQYGYREEARSRRNALLIR